MVLFVEDYKKIKKTYTNMDGTVGYISNMIECCILTLYLHSEILSTGRICENKQKQSRGWMEL